MYGSTLIKKEVSKLTPKSSMDQRISCGSEQSSSGRILIQQQRNQVLRFKEKIILLWIGEILVYTPWQEIALDAIRVADENLNMVLFSEACIRI